MKFPLNVRIEEFMFEYLNFKVIVSLDDATVGQDGTVAKVAIKFIVRLIDRARINITWSWNFLIRNNFPRFIFTFGTIRCSLWLNRYLLVFVEIWYNIDQMYCMVNYGFFVQMGLTLNP